MESIINKTKFVTLTALLLVVPVCFVTAQQRVQSNKVANQGGRDPFRKYEPPRIVVKKSNVLMPPSIEERISQYRAQKQAAMNARIPAPKPTTALLLGEVQVVGISRSPRGYAAIVEATPIKMSFVIYPGERFYDGQLVAIEDNRLVFRREIVFVDGKRERSVELKSLRQQSTVDAFTAATISAHPTTAATAEKPADKPAPAEKP
jgi:hypothetical protein